MATYHTRKQIFKVLEATSLRKRNWSTKLADHLTTYTSSPFFLFLNVGFFILWVSANIGIIPGVIPFDPYPFGFLTMVVSLEAIVLSIFVLISQNRAAQIATLREELHLRINLIAEQEITKSLEILRTLQKKAGIDTEDPDLEKMLGTINPTELEQSIERQLADADKSLVSELAGDLRSIILPPIKKNK
jgi:uncharacterized membrane protein